MKHEMPEDLQDFWVWQDAYDEGVRQAIKEVFTEFIEARYPLLIDMAKRQAHLIKDSKTLARIVCNILDMHMEVEEYLLALGEDAIRTSTTL